MVKHQKSNLLIIRVVFSNEFPEIFFPCMAEILLFHMGVLAQLLLVVNHWPQAWLIYRTSRCTSIWDTVLINPVYVTVWAKINTHLQLHQVKDLLHVCIVSNTKTKGGPIPLFTNTFSTKLNLSTDTDTDMCCVLTYNTLKNHKTVCASDETLFC